ncbi:hypothetical protein, partial [Stenotrophomonas maltophilia]|uniref:hypothetical protein n=1 Tax=Stenotrophomonas maltophilia TaxID=40324 RepID=UPI001EF9550C
MARSIARRGLELPVAIIPRRHAEAGLELARELRLVAETPVIGDLGNGPPVAGIAERVTAGEQPLVPD